VAAPKLRFPVGYAMSEECPFRTEDEEASTHVAERWRARMGAFLWAGFLEKESLALNSMDLCNDVQRR
jgi:hypothetical protein